MYEVLFTIGVLVPGTLYAIDRLGGYVWRWFEKTPKKVSKKSRKSSGPYRDQTKEAILDKIDEIATGENPKKVFCKDCKHFEYQYALIRESPMCRFGEKEYHPVHGFNRYTTNPLIKNKNFNCPDFEPGINNYQNKNYEYPDGVSIEEKD
jgi:hypothetical protein